MKRLLSMSIAVAALALALGPIALTQGGGLALPAPAATLAPPSPTPSPAASASPASAAPSGMSMSYPYSRGVAFDLNAVGAAIAETNLVPSKQPVCQISVTGTFSGSLAVTTSTTLAGLQDSANIAAWITAAGVYSVSLGSNTMLQVDTLVYSSGDPIVLPDCYGGTLLLKGTLPI